MVTARFAIAIQISPHIGASIFFHLLLPPRWVEYQRLSTVAFMPQGLLTALTLDRLAFYPEQIAICWSACILRSGFCGTPYFFRGRSGKKALYTLHTCMELPLNAQTLVSISLASLPPLFGGFFPALSCAALPGWPFLCVGPVALLLPPW